MKRGWMMGCTVYVQMNELHGDFGEVSWLRMEGALGFPISKVRAFWNYSPKSYLWIPSYSQPAIQHVHKVSQYKVHNKLYNIENICTTNV